MDHEKATETKLPMKYVLGDLEPVERDAFEEHLADCSRCMDEVWMGTTFAANARAVFRDEADSTAPAPRKWFQWKAFPAFAFSAALNIALAAGLGYGVLRIYPRMQTELAGWNQATAVAVVPVQAVARSASPAPQTVRTSAKLIVLSFDLPQRYDKYLYSIAQAGKGVVQSGEIDYSGTDSLNLQVPTGRLSPGEYQVTLTGVTGNQHEELGACRVQVVDK